MNIYCCNTLKLIDGTDTISSSVVFEMSLDITSNNGGSLSNSQVSTAIIMIKIVLQAILKHLKAVLQKH